MDDSVEIVETDWMEDEEQRDCSIVGPRLSGGGYGSTESRSGQSPDSSLSWWLGAPSSIPIENQQS